MFAYLLASTTVRVLRRVWLSRPLIHHAGLLPDHGDGARFVQLREPLVETPEIAFPLPIRHQCLWAQDQDGLHVFSGLQLAQDQACLDRFSDPDFICD